MKALSRRLLGFWAALWLCAVGPAWADTPPAAAAAAAPDRQVLILLRMPPHHFQPGADYSDGYGDAQGSVARQRMAARLAEKHRLTPVDEWPMPLLGLDCFIMAAPAGQSAREAAEQLSHDPGVAWAEPMSVYYGQGVTAQPNDPLFRTQPAATAWRLADLHEIATGRNVRIAVIDSAVERTHPDLAGQIEISQDFVTGRPGSAEQHGTGVAGVIAAIGDNNIGIVGVAPRARLMALRACWQPDAAQASTICDTLSLAKALYFAVTLGAQLINMSLAGPPGLLLGQLVDTALARGVTVVGAFDPDLPGGGFPASHAGVVAVTDEPQGVAPPGVFSAPGRDIPTTQPSGRWYLVNGSSYAAAHVSGLFALVREKGSARQGGLALVTARAGGGPIDACATLLRASGPCDCACARAAK